MSELEINDDEISDIDEIEQQLRTKNKEKKNYNFKLSNVKSLKVH